MAISKRRRACFIVMLSMSFLAIAGLALCQSAEQRERERNLNNDPSSKRSYIGLIGGFNISSASVPSGLGDASSKFGFLFGLVAEQRYAPNIFGCSELLYSKKGWKNKNVEFCDYTGYDYVCGNIDFDWNLTYLEGNYYVKFLIPTNSNVSPFIAAGLTSGVLIASKVEACAYGSCASDEAQDAFNTFDLGLLLGSGMELKLPSGPRLVFGIRYSLGLLSIDKGSSDFKNKGFSFTASVLF
jgi:hypothetical protein